MNGVHLSGVLPGRQAGAWSEKEHNMSVAQSAPSNERTVVRLSGGLDLAAAPELREQLIDVLHRGPQLLILDLSRVLTCDAAGLAVLIGTQRRARLLGIKMRLLAPSLPVTRVLRSTGLHRSFTIHAVNQAAV
jgi:anti-anti-sigma factor